MKKILSTIFALFALTFCYTQNGYNLVFNRVIDTTLVIEINTPTDLCNNPQYSNDLVVPSGKVWKLISLGQNERNVELATSCSGNTSYSNALLSSVINIQGTYEYPIHTTFAGGGGIYQTDFWAERYYDSAPLPLWFNAASTLKLKAFSNSHCCVRNTFPRIIMAHFSIIEFNVSQ
tara:strand:+ start:102 stop:629 length:528 start_codon:yes stop_codon:yes gene_type:complete